MIALRFLLTTLFTAIFTLACTLSPASPAATPVPPASSVTAAPFATPILQRAQKPTAEPAKPTNNLGVTPGIAVLVAEQLQLVAGKRIGLITNPTGIGPDLRPDVDWLRTVPGAQIVALFAGEHGLWGAEEAGKKLSGTIDPYTGAPVYSLYGDTVRPKPEWLRGLDVLIFDIQNVGSQFYTYKYTMSFAMEAAAKAGVPFIVLDRPNPAGGEVVEGPIIAAHDIWRHPLPVRHGMTSGELAQMWNAEYRLAANLTVVKMKGWRRDMAWDETGLPWVAPSPNIPTPDTALAYAGQVLIESVANVSEGRGTTKPFLLSGAPWVDPLKAAADLNARHLPGVAFRPAYFQPTKPGEKFTGEMAGGVELYFTDRRPYQAVLTTLNVLDAYRASGNGQPIVAKGSIVNDIGAASSIAQRVAGYQSSIADFLKTRQRYLLY